MPLQQLLGRLRRFWTHDIWAAGLVRDRTAKGRGLALLRVASITISGLQEMHVAIRAAALSYSSLLALGPLIALAVLISGFALGNKDPAIAAQVAQYDKATEKEQHAVPAKPGTAYPVAPLPPPDPEMTQILNNFITNSRSGTAGVIGLATLFAIVIGLFTTIKKTFNDICGVRRGRNLVARIVYYWSVITLGALLFFTSLTLLSAGAFLNIFFEKVPLGAQLKDFFVWMLPSGSVLLLVVLLTLFYRLVPHTRVRWRAALLGAVIVTA